jgi:hypothetical protein
MYICHHCSSHEDSISAHSASSSDESTTIRNARRSIALSADQVEEVHRKGSTWGRRESRAEYSGSGDRRRTMSVKATSFKRTLFSEDSMMDARRAILRDTFQVYEVSSFMCMFV